MALNAVSDELQLLLIIADRALNDDVLADSLTYKMNLVQARAGIGLCSLRGMFSIPLRFDHLRCCPLMVSWHHATSFECSSASDHRTPRQTYRSATRSNIKIGNILIYRI